MGDVHHLIDMAHHLDEMKIADIAQSYREHGFPHRRFAVAAARRMNREAEAYRAAHDVSIVVHLAGMANGHDELNVRYAAQAGSNAGFAAATEDLIGVAGYSNREYADLIGPWYIGFGDRPWEREESG